MQFPNSGSGRPYVRLDARTGSFKASTPEGSPVLVDMKGKVLDLDLENAKQGWLSVDQQGVNFVPLKNRDDWIGTPQPSKDHAPAVSLDLMSDAFAEPRVREFRGNSRAVTTFIANVASEAGEIPAGKAVRVRIKAVRQINVGRGTSIDLEFDLAPQDKWPDLSAFDAHRDVPAQPTTQPPTQDDDWA